LASSIRQIAACAVIHLSLDAFLKVLRVAAHVVQTFKNFREFFLRQWHPGILPTSTRPR